MSKKNITNEEINKIIENSIYIGKLIVLRRKKLITQKEYDLIIDKIKKI